MRGYLRRPKLAFEPFKRTALERQFADTDCSLGGILKAIEAGAWSTTLQDRLAELEVRKKTLRDELAASGATTEEMVIDLDGAKMYRKYVADLEATLNGDEVRTATEALLRGLIDRVVLIPDPTAPDGLRGELNGAVADILLLSERAPRRRAAGDGPANDSTAGPLLIRSPAADGPVPTSRQCLHLRRHLSEPRSRAQQEIASDRAVATPILPPPDCNLRYCIH
jgi:hypothetical protein